MHGMTRVTSVGKDMLGEAADRPRMPGRAALVGGVVVAALLVAGLLVLNHDLLVRLFEWIESLGLAGGLVMIGLYVVACLTLIPATLLTLGSGFAFGLFWGTIVVSIGSTLGATAAFVTGRTIGRRWIEARIARSPRFQALDRAIAQDGLKIILLIRLSPVLPFVFLNYALGLTRVSLRDYVLGSWVGMLPMTVVYVYIGSVAMSLASLFSDDVQSGPVERTVFALGLVATIIVAVVITRAARRALADAVEEE